MLSTLCQRCGICCGGSLFTFLPVSPEEGERMRPLGVRVEARRDGRLAMALPCPALRDSCCSAYAARPLRCREFVCELGKALERREVSLEAALDVVAEAKRRLAELEAWLGPSAPGETRGLLQRARQLEAVEPDDARFKAVRALARDVEATLARDFVGR